MAYRIDNHHEDPWADEIILNGIRSFRLIIRERYKTSDLSGDEWRFSYVWQVQHPPAVVGRLNWADLHGPLSQQDTAIASFYPAFRTSHQNWQNEVCFSIQFRWKGYPLAEMSYDGKPVAMLHAIGSIAWAKIVAREQLGWKKNNSSVCAQPGCARTPVSLFRKVSDFYPRIGVRMHKERSDYYRRFCKKHLRRGDCGLDDADSNYELIEDVGPDGNEPDPSAVRPSRFGGFIDL